MTAYERLKKFEAETDALCKSRWKPMEDTTQLKNRIAELEAENERLQEALDDMTRRFEHSEWLRHGGKV